MTRMRWLAAGVFLTCWGCTARARAQTPPAHVQPTDTRPVREARPWFVGGELGWNGLSGLGASFAYHLIPRLAVDAGLGVSATGLRAGARARVNLLTSAWTPFVGAGFSYALGSGEKPVKAQIKGEAVKFQVLPSPFLQLAAGVNYTGAQGFAFTATTGYAILLRDSNTRYSEGSTQAFKDVTAFYKGGPIVSVTFGYAF